MAVELAAAAPEEFDIWAVYPSARLVPPKLRFFLAALEAALIPAVASPPRDA